MPARKGNVGDPTTRNALLDAAQALMVTDGYAAATTRRVAQAAGVNSALVSYYFGSLDGMFVELFQRGSELSFARMQAALGSAQPLWAFWDLIHDLSSSRLTMELIALANHRKVLRDEISSSSRRFRKLQVKALNPVLDAYGISDRWPASTVVLVLSSLSRFMLMEQDFGVRLGHAETVARVEQLIHELEGERASHGREGCSPPRTMV